MSFYSNYQVLFGNHSLSNRRYQTTEIDFRSSSPFELQTQAKPTVIGSVITRQRIGAKTITVKGGDTDQSGSTESGTQTDDYSENRFTRLNQIFTQQDTYLRTCPNNKRVIVADCQATTDWAVSGDAGALTVDQDDFQHVNASLSSNVTVSTGLAIYTKTLTTPVSVANLTPQKNLEGFVYISDTRFFEGLELRVGSDSTNYYSNVNVNYFKAKDDFTSTEWNKQLGATVTTKTITFPGVDRDERVDQTIDGAEYTGFAGVVCVKVRAKVTSGTLNFRLVVNESGGAGIAVNNHTATTDWQWFNLSLTATGAGSVFFNGIYNASVPNAGTLIVDQVRFEYNGLTEYAKTYLATNYKGDSITNGWNYVSIPLDSSMEYGTVDTSNLDYLQTIIKYDTSQEDFTVKLDGFQVVDDNYTRNYLASASSDVSNNPEWTQTDSGFFSVDLFAYKGFSTWTHKREVSLDYEITTLSNTAKLDLNGNYEPLLTNTFNFIDATNVTDLRYNNITTGGQALTWNRAWQDEDVLVFDQVQNTVTTNGDPQDFNGKLPTNKVGINYVTTSVVTSAVSNISQESAGDTDIIITPFSSYTARAQSFTATETGTLTEIAVKIKSGGAFINIASGSPSNIVASFGSISNFDINYKWVTALGSASLVSGQTYYIVLSTDGAVTWPV